MGCFHYRVEDVDALYEELKGRGATFGYLPVIQPYGMKEFAVRDPNGTCSGSARTGRLNTKGVRHIEACLQVEHHQAWISFVDLTGARVRLEESSRSSTTSPSPPLASVRRSGAFHRTLNRQRKAEPDWREGE